MVNFPANPLPFLPFGVTIDDASGLESRQRNNVSIFCHVVSSHEEFAIASCNGIFHEVLASSSLYVNGDRFVWVVKHDEGEVEWVQYWVEEQHWEVSHTFNGPQSADDHPQPANDQPDNDENVAGASRNHRALFTDLLLSYASSSLF
ncbi:hypothetical protein GUJ93_ZPchr0001g33039 [Zizania palustris]|uniref:Uncharacterized protein n=1 Tax=Zizania palustris TaxID=103762 RepID=A0A8J5S0L1_ZIZPA|nr:hypothetical protein GUJ93_ZPchr0001g33039 [Zizania palustris]